MNTFTSWLAYSSESFHENTSRKTKYLFLSSTILLALSPLYRWYTSKPQEDTTPKREAPAIASTMPGISLINQIRAFIWNDGMIQKGYEQHKGGMFRMPWMGQWVTVVSGKYITEMVRAPDSMLSFQELINYSLQLQLLVGPEVSRDQVHLPVIRTLTRNLDTLYPEILDETKFILAEKLGKAGDDGWIVLDANKTFHKIIGQLNHRAFIGLPLCRDEKWTNVMKRCQVDLSLRGLFLRLFPKTKRASAHAYLSKWGGAWDEGIELLTPVIEERRKMVGELPNDLLSWAMTRIPGDEPSPRTIIDIFQLIDLVAQNTTYVTFVHAILYVAAYPDEVEQLREEITHVIRSEGWTHAAINHMPKLDSFVRETQRLSGMTTVSMNRIAMQDFTFSNGITIPKGTTLQAIGNPLHHDPEIYPEPLEFKPFRFYELMKKEEKGSKRFNLVTPGEEYLAWGRGKHACPGRWFAAMIIKHLLAYLIAQYDIKLEPSTKGIRPPDFHIAGGVIPNLKAKVLLKKREDHLGGDDSAFLR